MDENWAAFYWDEPEQILFDSVSFPMEISDAQEYFDGISFDDINGDGSSGGGKVYFDEDGDLIESDYVLTHIGIYRF